MIVGVDVGGTNTDLVVLKDGFDHLATVRTSQIKDLSSLIDDLCPEAEAVGIGAAVWIRRGEIVKAPNIRVLPSFEVSKPFVLENDANCFAYYAAKVISRDCVLGITVGTGVGSGIVVDGRIYRGCGVAGEIGHVYVGGNKICSCGGVGHVEAYFGGRAIGNVEHLLESGEIYELEGFEIFCRAVAAAIMILNPEAVVLGGRIGGRLDAGVVESTTMQYVAEELKPEFYAIKDDLAVAKGAAILAKETIFRIPQQG